MDETVKQQRCNRCGYVWISRIDKPTSCPNCKRYDWMNKKVGDKHVNNKL